MRDTDEYALYSTTNEVVEGEEGAVPTTAAATTTTTTTAPATAAATEDGTPPGSPSGGMMRCLVSPHFVCKIKICQWQHTKLRATNN